MVECRAGVERLAGWQPRRSGNKALPRRFWAAAQVRFVVPLAAVVVASTVAALARADPRAFLAPVRHEVGGVRLSRRSSSSIARRVGEGGEFGVLPETPSPVIDTSEEDDPLLERLVAVVQSADSKRGVDISAFWIKEGYEVMVLVTALSRPQLQAIANAIDYKMRHGLRLKRNRVNTWTGLGIRREAQVGWCCMTYPRLSIHIMTPIQRNYYDIESTWRDENQDYEKIPLDELLREDSFGNLKLKKELGDGDEQPPPEPADVGAGSGAGSGMDYEEDEEDPFWS